MVEVKIELNLRLWPMGQCPLPQVVGLAKTWPFWPNRTLSLKVWHWLILIVKRQWLTLADPRRLHILQALRFVDLTTRQWTIRGLLLMFSPHSVTLHLSLLIILHKSFVERNSILLFWLRSWLKELRSGVWMWNPKVFLLVNLCVALWFIYERFLLIFWYNRILWRFQNNVRIVFRLKANRWIKVGSESFQWILRTLLLIKMLNNFYKFQWILRPMNFLPLISVLL